MSENKIDRFTVMARDSLTTSPLEKALTTAHLQQRLAQAALAQSTQSTSPNSPAIGQPQQDSNRQK
jgi:hypothetical protein